MYRNEDEFVRGQKIKLGLAVLFAVLWILNNKAMFWLGWLARGHK